VSALVPRPRLVRRLAASQSVPVILLAAPAGYGKTTLLHEWAAQDRRPFAWVTLGCEDNEPLVLIDAVAESLERAAVICRGAVPPLPVKGTARRGRAWAALRRALCECEQPFVLVLDDAEAITSPGSLDLISSLVDHVPAGSQVAIATRRVAAIRADRLRAEERMLELGEADLVMTRTEALALLRLAGIRDARGAEILVQRAEGWPAALTVAALTVRGEDAGAPGLAGFTGADRAVSDYVRDELMSGLAPAEVEFLVRSSVLDRLSGPVCDFVLDRDDSARVLASLARTKLLLVPLDRNNSEFRHHRLLRETLRSELRQLEPDHERTLHGRASSWCDREGEVDCAVAQAIASGNVDAAGNLIARRAPGYLAFGRRTKVCDWLASFSEDQIARSPGLALTAAATALATGSRQGAERWLAESAATISTARPALRKPLEAQAALLRAALSPDGVAGVAEQVSQARRLLPDKNGALTLACLLEGAADHLRGRTKSARTQLEEGARRGAAAAPGVQVLCLAQLALIASDEDDRQNAEVLAARAKAQVERVGLSGYPTCALVYAVCADLEARARSVETAQHDMRDAKRLLEQLEDFTPWYAAECSVALARAAVRVGDVPLARRLLGDAERVTESHPPSPLLRRWIDDGWAQTEAVTRSSTGSAWGLTTAELRVLQYMPTHLSFPMVAEELYVSANTVKTHARAVYRKLDASSRGEAVLRAREAGLLDSEVAA
jgi:LuxR family transcriptional regulator, maltose regulon positive regulatory protein